ncbi:GTP-binding protein TrmE N-terminus-domain-containing protein [Usnea florida]
MLVGRRFTLSDFSKFHSLTRGKLYSNLEYLESKRIIPAHLLSPEGNCSLVTSNGTTIYALSTAPGRAAIAVIRISGPACMNIYRAFCPQSLPPKPRYATLRTLLEPSVASVDQQDAQVLDANALVFYFPAPHTATGEDILELHVHGGIAVVKAVLAAIPRTIPKQASQTIRYAEPGEFTRRAFFNNRLDLLQVEALGDTLAADTEQQRRQAVRGSTDVLTERYEAWRRKLLYARGELEALIDFSEDQHFDESPANLCASVAKQVRQLKSQLQANIESASRGELLRNGIDIALVGAPNAGKSSLLNQIVGREAAIVSSEAGTTRDIVDVNVDIGGFFCRFGDLAGLRKQTLAAGAHQLGEIEKEGIRRAKERALTADVIVVVLSTEAEEGPASSEMHVSIGAEVEEVLQHIDLNSQKVVCVLNKADLFADNAHLEKSRSELGQHRVLREFLDLSETPLFAVSCTNAQASKITSLSDPSGIQTFLTGLTKLFGRMTAAVVPREHNGTGSDSAWAESLGATERQRLLLLQCLGHLESFLDEVQNNDLDTGGATGPENDVDVVLAAESLRSAAECLAKIIGRGESGDVEEVLGVVFEK